MSFIYLIYLLHSRRNNVSYIDLFGEEAISPASICLSAARFSHTFLQRDTIAYIDDCSKETHCIGSVSTRYYFSEDFGYIME